MAERIGCSAAYLCKLEQGKASVPTQRFIQSVAVGFTVNAMWLEKGEGPVFWEVTGDPRTRDAMPEWGEEQWQPIMGVLDALPDALAADKIIAALTPDVGLAQLQALWAEVRQMPLPLPARLFWNEVYVRCQMLKHDQLMLEKNGLQAGSTNRKLASEMKPLLPTLIRDLRRLCKPEGMRSKLAAHLGVPLSRVSEWLGGKHEPGGEIALKMQGWIKKVRNEKVKP